MKNFITIEGCDGVGKTAQNRLLKEYCENSKQTNIVFTREPGGSVVAEKIRAIILDANNSTLCDECEAFLYAAARVQHLNDIIAPALSAGKTVICDRYVDSSYVYQGVARGLGLDKVIHLNDIAVGQYMPEYTVFLDLSPELAFARKGGVDKTDRLEVQADEFYVKVYEGYKELINRYPDRFIVIDASGTKDETHHKVITALQSKGILR